MKLRSGLFAGVLVAVALGAAMNTAHAQLPAGEEGPRELVIVDSATPDAATLIAALVARSGSGGRRADVVILEADRDGIAQIGAVLSQYTGLGAIHLLSHGRSGRLLLGNGELHRERLLTSAAEIRGWGDALAHGGDLLLYGCDVAADAAGRDLVVALGQLTRADVAASIDPTGSVDLGGDWILEFETGPTEAETIGAASTPQGWSGLLPMASLQPVADTYIKLKKPGDNFGLSPELIIDRETTDLHRLLMQFDVSSIPDNAVVVSATLKLEATQVGGTLNIAVYEVLQDWSEGTGPEEGEPGEANWTERTATFSWLTAGGTFDSDAVATINTDSAGQHTWVITPLVRAWVNGSKVNHGLMVASPDGGGNRTATYASLEGAPEPLPLLEISWRLRRVTIVD